jgi:O-antigen ligase
MSALTAQFKQELATAFLPGRRREAAVFALLFLFLPLVETVRNAGSTAFVLMVLLSLPGFWSGWRTMEREDKRVFQAFMLLILVALISLIHTSDWAEAGRRFSRLLRLAFVIPIFVYLRQADRARLEAVFRWGLAATGIVLGLVALYEKASGGWYWWRPASGAYQHILFGEYAVACFSIAVVLLLAAPSSRLLRSALLLSALGSFLAAMWSGARSAWIALPAVLLILAWYYWKSEPDSRARRRSLVAATVVVLIGLLALSQVQSVKKRLYLIDSNIASFVSGRNDNTSLGTRFLLWRNAYVIWQRSPVLGTGLGDYRMDNRAIVRSGKTNLAFGLGEAHNIFMEFLATTGVLGLVALIIAIVAVPVRYFMRRWRLAASKDERAFALGGLMVPVCFSIFGLGQTWTAHQPAITAFALVLVVLMALSRVAPETAKPESAT